MALTREFSGDLYTGDGTSRLPLNVPFRIQLVAFDGVSFYAWRQVCGTPQAAFVEQDGGQVGLLTPGGGPAFEANGNAAPIGIYVEVRQAYLDPDLQWVYVFDYCCGGGSTSSSGSTDDETCLVVVTDVVCRSNPDGSSELVVTKKRICGTFTISDP